MRQKKNQEILILVGIPGSGKSTWAKDYVKYNAGWVRVSRDDFRLMLKQAQVCEPKLEDLITTLVDETIKQAIFRKESVIIDATNLKVRYIEQFIEKFQHLADINFRIFDISLEKAIERDKNREATVGEEVIKRMYKDYKIIIDSYPFQPIKRSPYKKTIHPNFNSNLPDAVIFDLDGTLADMGNRGPYEYDKVWKDNPIELVREQVEFHASKNRIIIFLTGRDEECREETVKWLDHYNIKGNFLYMRKDGDSRKDSIVKREIYQELIAPQYNVLCVYDDRLSVLEMWYQENIFSFNVNQGNILF